MSAAMHLQFLIWIVFWKFAKSNQYIASNAQNLSEIDLDQLNLVHVENASLFVANLLQELDYPNNVMAVANLPTKESRDIDCPLNLCNTVKGIALVPNRPRLFVACLRKRQFCGLCPQGTIAQSNGSSFRCIPAVDISTNETHECNIDKICQADFSQRLLLSVVNETKVKNFIICSKKRSFCGFCPSKIAIFNQSTLTCDFTFPEIKFVCPERSSMQMFPDPLTPCSPLAYVCLPGKSRGVAIRCPDPKMRHSQQHNMNCELPEHVPECGGLVRSSGNENTTEIESLANATQLARGGYHTANCVRNCMYYYRTSKRDCIIFCT